MFERLLIDVENGFESVRSLTFPLHAFSSWDYLRTCWEVSQDTSKGKWIPRANPIVINLITRCTNLEFLKLRLPFAALLTEDWKNAKPFEVVAADCRLDELFTHEQLREIQLTVAGSNHLSFKDSVDLPTVLCGENGFAKWMEGQFLARQGRSVDVIAFWHYHHAVDYMY